MHFIYISKFSEVTEKLPSVVEECFIEEIVSTSTRPEMECINRCITISDCRLACNKGIYFIKLTLRICLHYLFYNSIVINVLILNIVHGIHLIVLLLSVY